MKLISITTFTIRAAFSTSVSQGHTKHTSRTTNLLPIVTKIQRQKSSTKFYNLINQNTEISNNKNTNSYLNFHKKTIPVIAHEEQISWSQNIVLKHKESSSPL